MRIVQYGKESENTLDEVAEKCDVDKEKLWEYYLQVMKNNYEQDLYDIAKENWYELKGDE